MWLYPQRLAIKQKIESKPVEMLERATTKTMKILVWWPTRQFWDEFASSNPYSDKLPCLKCPHCGGSNTVRRGLDWTRNPVRLIYGHKENFWLAGCFWSCTDCGINKKWMNTHPDVIRKLPFAIRNKFPVVLTKKKGASTFLVRHIARSVCRGVTFSHIRKSLHAIRARAWDSKGFEYYQSRLIIKRQRRSILDGHASGAGMNAHVREVEFPEFQDKYAACRVPSQAYLKEVYILDYEKRLPFLRARADTVVGKFMYADTHYKVRVFTLGYHRMHFRPFSLIAS